MVTVKLTEREAQALASAAGYALEPGCEWNDTEQGCGDPKRTAAAERAIGKVIAAMATAIADRGAP